MLTEKYNKKVNKMNYAKFNEHRQNLKYLNDFKKPLDQILSNLIYSDNFSFKYKEQFEYFFIEQTEETKKYLENNVNESDLHLNTEIEVTIMKLAGLLEEKEEREKQEFKKLI